MKQSMCWNFQFINHFFKFGAPNWQFYQSYTDISSFELYEGSFQPDFGSGDKPLAFDELFNELDQTEGFAFCKLKIF